MTLAVDLDFSGEVVLVTFHADETLANPLYEVTSYINITDDSINEAEQVFLLKMEVDSLLDNSSIPLQQKPLSLCKIIDDDGESYLCTKLILVV